MKISKTTYIIIICLFIGAFGSYMYKHYIKPQPKVQVQDTQPSANNPVNPAIGIPNKGKVTNVGTNGALVYQTPTSKNPYGVVDSGTIVTMQKKVGDLYEIDYNGEALYISAKDISFNLN